MNHAVSLHQTAVFKRPETRGSVLGWGISLLVHALALAWLWHVWLLDPLQKDAGPVKRVEVRLVPIAEAPLPVPSNVTVQRHSPMQTPAEPRRTQPQHQAVAIPVSPAATTTAPEPSADGANVTGTGTSTSPDAPAFDIAAGRATARLIARQNGNGMVALPSRKPAPDLKADHHVADALERARRIDCQTARAGSTNLLANVVTLAVDMAKNAVDDSGCKW
jgi:hypothetical protein